MNLTTGYTFFRNYLGAICAFVLLLSANTSFADCTIDDLSGEYVGYMVNNGEGTRAFFYRDAESGNLTGHFILGDDGVRGELLNLSLDSNVVTGIMSDIYSTDDVVFIFSADCKRFNGVWDMDYTWTGVKI